MQYPSVKVPKSTMPSGHLMYILTSILGCINVASTSYISTINPSSSYYRVGPIRILLEFSDVNGYNDSMNSTLSNCMHPLTTFLDFRRINPSAFSLLLNTHLAGTRFLHLSFTTPLLVGVQVFLDRKLFTSDIADIYHKCPFGLVVAFYLRVPFSPYSVEIDVIL